MIKITKYSQFDEVNFRARRGDRYNIKVYVGCRSHVFDIVDEDYSYKHPAESGFNLDITDEVLKELYYKYLSWCRTFLNKDLKNLKKQWGYKKKTASLSSFKCGVCQKRFFVKKNIPPTLDYMRSFIKKNIPAMGDYIHCKGCDKSCAICLKGGVKNDA